MKIKQIIKIISCFLIALILFTACGNEQKNDTSVTPQDTSNLNTANETPKIADAKKILYSLPSPLEAATLLKMAGATFDKSSLNLPSNASKYVTNDSKALNLGIYGTDLIFANIFDQTQESTDYLKACNTLASALGIDAAFGEDTYKRLKANVGNRDSMFFILSDASLIADAYFKENERPTASGLSAAGAWIEGLYIATRVVNKTKNEEIIERVVDQKHSLNDLIAILESYGSEKDVAPVLNDLKEMKELYDGLKVEKTKKEAGSKTVGVSRKIIITPEQLKSISEKIEVIRNKIVN